VSLLDALASPRAEERAAACRDATTDPSAPVWIEPLALALADADARVRLAASDALAKLGCSHDVIPALKRALHGDDPRARWGAARTLARLAPPEPALIPAAVQALASDQGSERWQAARLLVELGRMHGEVLSLVLGLARSGDSLEVRRMAIFCLRELSPDGSHTREVLLESAGARDTALRRAALTALAGLLDPPATVLQKLAEAAEADRDPACRELATRALDELNRRVTRPALA